MNKIKQSTVIIISILFIIAFLGQPVYAVTCQLSINDEGTGNGFKKVGDDLYYVVTISSKVWGGSVSGIRFKLCYDKFNLEMVELQAGEELDLGDMGKFEGQPYILCYDNPEGYEYLFNENGSEIFCLGKFGEQYEMIEDNEIDLVKICFKVNDNIQEKRLVYIDTQSKDTQFPGGHAKSDIRYVTNGVPMPDDILQDGGNGAPSPGGTVVDDGDGESGGNAGDKKDPVKTPGKDDPTKAPTALPFTGFGKVIILGILVVSAVVGVQYFKLRKMRDIK